MKADAVGEGIVERLGQNEDARAPTCEHKPFVGQMLDRVAHRVAINAKAIAQNGFCREFFAFGIVTFRNCAAEALGDGSPYGGSRGCHEKFMGNFGRLV